VVDHNARISKVNGALQSLHIFSVVEMQGNRRLGLMCQGDDNFKDSLKSGVADRAFTRGNDDGYTQFLSSLNNSDRRFQVLSIKGRIRKAFCDAGTKQFFDVY